ncbi:hypothetical protein CDD80_3387 [Ophiocordyceps camponoti-rufipedis]|uniref:rRNA adenine N(6)-methyltransferase n=1 Tax=Ophiocordyceps camponoti-rufipedis TaxID=2004952 RepID=A0A2C5ZDG6_9HYPO|nr:hypothetical protein CDD80_3387 [Ophiocordyceps camponoti-rufipedis]
MAVHGSRAASSTAQIIAQSLKESKSKSRKDTANRLHDPHRVNVVSEELCDDIINYIGPSIERHRGCDLVDINPGVGIWSKKLHKFLEPRKHVLMEPDVERYRQFLKPLLENPRCSTQIKSGFVWKDLLDVIRAELPLQQAVSSDAVPTRNDTLLVTANVATHPKRAYRNFASISTMVIYQLLSCIRHSSLFQSYGLVRMLLWMNDDDKTRLLPRAINRRRRSAFENETSCEWFCEVASPEPIVDQLMLRNEWIDRESGCKVIQRMQKQGLVMPAHRQPAAYIELNKNWKKWKGKKLADLNMPFITRPYQSELLEVEQKLEENEKSKKLSLRRTALIKTGKSDLEARKISHELWRRRQAIFQLASESPADFAAADAEWNARIDCITKNQRNIFLSNKDNLHIYRQDPPVMLWDRRTYEPLLTDVDEFFPRARTVLVDIQPKAMHPLLRQYGQGTERAADMSDVMLRSWFLNLTLTCPKAMDTIWAGAGELVKQCPSLTDPSLGGSPMSGYGAINARMLSERQWIELLQAWMDWPFRPSYEHLMGRVLHEPGEEEEEDEVTTKVASNL